jgi:magnesium-protoporphyrin IX monomethyl ester (oxidative) cyclase
MRAHTKRKIGRVLLVKPPYTILDMYPKITIPPLGLAYLAAVIERDCDVRIVDSIAEGFEHEERAGPGRIRFGLSWEELRARIRDYGPDVVGVSCLFSTQFANGLKTLEIAKGVDPDVITMIGGSHSSALPESTLRNRAVDFVIIGEGEMTFRELLDALASGKSLEGIDGLAFRDGERTVVNPKTRYVADLDEIPFPSRHLLPMEKYFAINLPHAALSRRRRTTQIVSSRGCPSRCIFCATTRFWGNRFRGRSAGNVLAEIDHLVQRYRVRELHFEDDNMTQDRERAIAIFKGLIERGYDLIWTTPNGVSINTLDEELIALMRESGCYELCLPVESGCPRVLREIIHKPLLLDRAARVVQAVKDLGIVASGSFVVGFPGERFDELRQTFDLAWNLRFDNCDFNIATPLPGTELYSLCIESGCLRDEFSFDKLEYLEAFIDTPEFTAGELKLLVSRNTMRYRLALLARHPAEFFKRYVALIFKQPRFFFRYSRGLLRQALRSFGRPIEAATMEKRILREYASAPLMSRLHVRIRSRSTPLHLIQEYVPRRGRIVDLGCGHGLFTLWMALASPRRSVCGVDVSGQKLAVAGIASRAAPNVSWRRADLVETDVEPCDAVTIIDVLYLLPFEAQRDVLAKCFRALPEGGHLFIHRAARKPLWKFAIAYLQERLSVKTLRITHGNALYFWKDAELAGVLESLGFRVRAKRLDGGYLHPHQLLICCKES